MLGQLVLSLFFCLTFSSLWSCSHPAHYCHGNNIFCIKQKFSSYHHKSLLLKLHVVKLFFLTLALDLSQEYVADM